MNIWLLILILFLLGAFGSAPWWGHQGFGTGWGASGVFGFIVLVLVVLWATGKLGNGPSA